MFNLIFRIINNKIEFARYKITMENPPAFVEPIVYEYSEAELNKLQEQFDGRDIAHEVETIEITPQMLEWEEAVTASTAEEAIAIMTGEKVLDEVETLIETVKQIQEVVGLLVASSDGAVRELITENPRFSNINEIATETLRTINQEEPAIKKGEK